VTFPFGGRSVWWRSSDPQLMRFLDPGRRLSAHDQQSMASPIGQNGFGTLDSVEVSVDGSAGGSAGAGAGG